MSQDTLNLLLNLVFFMMHEIFLDDVDVSISKPQPKQYICPS